MSKSRDAALIRALEVPEPSDRPGAERSSELLVAAKARSKTESTARICHELRTPLNVIVGYSQLLCAETTDCLSERQRAHIESIRSAGEHLMELIDDLGEAPSLDPSQLPIKPCGIEMPDLLDEVLGLTRLMADRQQVVIEALYRQRQHARIWADPVRLRQVMLNIMINAVKYNRIGGSVMVDAEADSDWVHTNVSDTGLGMTRQQLNHLFEPYNRLGREHSAVDGAGLGMALTRQLVERMHGRITVLSEPNCGTSVLVSLPAREFS